MEIYFPFISPKAKPGVTNPRMFRSPSETSIWWPNIKEIVTVSGRQMICLPGLSCHNSGSNEENMHLKEMRQKNKNTFHLGRVYLSHLSQRKQSNDLSNSNRLWTFPRWILLPIWAIPHLSNNKSTAILLHASHTKCWHAILIIPNK